MHLERSINILLFILFFSSITEDLLLQEDLVEMIPALEEANAISEELDKKVKFEIVVLSAKARGLTSGRTEVEHGHYFFNFVYLYHPGYYVWLLGYIFITCI